MGIRNGLWAAAAAAFAIAAAGCAPEGQPPRCDDVVETEFLRATVETPSLALDDEFVRYDARYGSATCPYSGKVDQAYRDVYVSYWSADTYEELVADYDDAAASDPSGDALAHTNDIGVASAESAGRIDAEGHESRLVVFRASDGEHTALVEVSGPGTTLAMAHAIAVEVDANVSDR